MQIIYECTHQSARKMRGREFWTLERKNVWGKNMQIIATILWGSRLKNIGCWWHMISADPKWYISDINDTYRVSKNLICGKKKKKEKDLILNFWINQLTFWMWRDTCWISYTQTNMQLVHMGPTPTQVTQMDTCCLHSASNISFFIAYRLS